MIGTAVVDIEVLRNRRAEFSRLADFVQQHPRAAGVKGSLRKLAAEIARYDSKAFWPLGDNEARIIQQQVAERMQKLESN